MKKRWPCPQKLFRAVNPDLIDINFGCPVKKVVCKGAGAGVLKDVDLMVRLDKSSYRQYRFACYRKNPFGLG